MNNISKICRNECCGCMSCISVCPKKAIDVTIDDGFDYPVIDRTKCIDCGRCISVCCAKNKATCLPITKSYIAVSKDEDLYANSSSGGVFATIANHYVKNGWSVVGAALTKNYHVKHIIVNSVDDLHVLQGSKYVQSDCTDIYKKIKRVLDDGNNVLFSGTPCQVAALRNYLDCDYSNLLCIDLVCHGVPSPYFFEYYINKHYVDRMPVKDISFRTKDKYERYGFNLKFTKGTKKMFVPGSLDLYYRMFLKGLSFRESCYTCQYANGFRSGDITIGDCGNSNLYNFHSDKTISTVYPITKKGQDIWDLLSGCFDYKEVDFEFEMSANGQLNHPTIRNDFRDDLYSKGFDYTELKSIKWLGKPSARIYIKEYLKRIVPEKYRKKIKQFF